tara:strand:- start:1829 stop:2083 length:255 start_codon:yes stop_codon:yes gene_type:complete
LRLQSSRKIRDATPVERQDVVLEADEHTAQRESSIIIIADGGKTTTTTSSSGSSSLERREEHHRGDAGFSPRPGRFERQKSTKT